MLATLSLALLAAPQTPSTEGPVEALWHHLDPAATLLEGEAQDLAFAPDGLRAYATHNRGGVVQPVGVLRALEAETGALVWQIEQTLWYGGEFTRVRVSPDGASVYVGGLDQDPVSTRDALWVGCYDALTGALQWDTHWPGPVWNGQEVADLLVAPDGQRVYLYGDADDEDGGEDVSVIALDAATGQVQWTRTHGLNVSYPGGFYNDAAIALACSADGSKLFGVYSSSSGSHCFNTCDQDRDVYVHAYDAATGASLWSNEFDSSPNSAEAFTSDTARAIAYLEESERVLVLSNSSAGWSEGGVLLAFDAIDGGLAWASVVLPDVGQITELRALAIEEDGSTAYVGGFAENTDGGANRDRFFASVDTTWGLENWSVQIQEPGTNERVVDLDLRADEGVLLTLGNAGGPLGTIQQELVLLAADAQTGAVEWEAEIAGPVGETGDDGGRVLRAAPTGRTVLAAGLLEVGNNVFEASVHAFARPWLHAEPAQLSALAGGSQSFALDAGGERAGLPYLVVGSLSGTAPGTPLGPHLLPLNVDAYLALSLASANSGSFQNTLGLLDSAGQAHAQLVLPAHAALIGLLAHHAYVVLGAGVEFVSNPVPLQVQ